MWEAIAANRRRSRLLIVLMGILLVLTGSAVGLYYEPNYGAQFGAIIALLVWVIMTLTALTAGDAILLATAGAHRIEKQDAPVLWNVVEEMTIAAGLPHMPEVYVIEDSGLNAFAVGRKPEKAAVAVTSGLLKRLNRDELQGVIAHEIGHVRNLDIRFMTLAAVMVGCITIIADVFFRSLRYGTGGRRSSRSGGNGGGGAAILAILALVVAVLAPIAAQILYFACSRAREYLADASAARFTRFPDGLASALEKIANYPIVMSPSKATAPLFIVNPLQAAGTEMTLFSTHPPLDKRVAILRAMGGQAGYPAYDAAFQAVTGGKGHLLGERTLADGESVAARQASVAPTPDEAPEEKLNRVQQVTDLLARIGNYLVLPCECGVKIKLPPEFRGDTIDCVRCGREHRIPRAELQLALATLPGASEAATPPPPVPAEPEAKTLVYQRQSDGWESFKCACGQTQQLSPNFAARRITCRRCQRMIEIA